MTFSVKTVLNQGIRSVLFPFKKIRVKPGTVLIETVLSGDPLYKHCREKTATQILVVLIVELCLAIQGLTHYINCSKFKLELKELTVCIVHQTNRVPSTMN